MQYQFEFSDIYREKQFICEVKRDGTYNLRLIEAGEPDGIDGADLKEYDFWGFLFLSELQGIAQEMHLRSIKVCRFDKMITEHITPNIAVGGPYTINTAEVTCDRPQEFPHALHLPASLFKQVCEKYNLQGVEVNTDTDTITFLFVAII